MKYQQEMHAVYTPEVSDDHRGSPFLEALPPLRAPVDLAKSIASIPQVPDEWRAQSQLFRTEKVTSLCEKLFFVSLGRHVDIVAKFQTMLYQGYTFRGNLDWPMAKIERGAVEAAWERGAVSASVSITRGGAFFGPSGAGKSATLERCCSLYPQIIHHGEFGGRHFTVTQIPYIWVLCPEDASEKGLLAALLSELDRLLGTDDAQIYSARKATLNDMMRALVRRCRVNAIGMIILDEIQALLKLSSDPSKTAQFLTRLSDATKVPIIKLGTSDARHLIGAGMFQARRSIGFTPWTNLREGLEWNTFTDQLFSMHLLKSDLDNEVLRDVLFKLSKGNPAIAVSVFKHAQLACLLVGQEVLTPERMVTVMGREAKIIEDAFRLLGDGDEPPKRVPKPPAPQKPEPDPAGELQPPPERGPDEDDDLPSRAAA